MEKYRALEGEHLRFATEDNILDLFPQVDMMISDTSSALNEFLLTYKPVVTFKNRRPGPQLIDIDKPELLLPSIERALARPADLMLESASTPTRSIRIDDGLHAARERQRFLDRIPLACIATLALRRAKTMFVVVGRDVSALIELLFVGVPVRFGLRRIVAGGLFCHRRNLTCRLRSACAKVVGRVGVEPTTY